MVTCTDNVEYSSSGVRDQTAELAAIALTGTTPTHTSPNRSSTNSGSSRYRKPSRGLPDLRDGASSIDGRTSQSEQARPGTIQEASEPASREISPPHTAHGRSALSDLLLNEPAISPTSSAHRTVRKQRSDDTNTTAGQEESYERREDAPLLGKPDDRTQKIRQKSYGALPDVESQPARPRKANQFQQIVSVARKSLSSAAHTAFTPKTWSAKAVWQQGIKQPVGLLPCVFLGLLLNVLDALSYGRTFCMHSTIQRSSLTSNRHDPLSP